MSYPLLIGLVTLLIIFLLRSSIIILGVSYISWVWFYFQKIAQLSYD